MNKNLFKRFSYYRSTYTQEQRVLLSQRPSIERIPRKELEEKYLGLCDEFKSVKCENIQNHEKLKRLATKLLRLTIGPKKTPSKESLSAEEHYQVSLMKLEAENALLKEKVSKQSLKPSGVSIGVSANWSRTPNKAKLTKKKKRSVSEATNSSDAKADTRIETRDVETLVDIHVIDVKRLSGGKDIPTISDYEDAIAKLSQELKREKEKLSEMEHRASELQESIQSTAEKVELENLREEMKNLQKECADGKSSRMRLTEELKACNADAKEQIDELKRLLRAEQTKVISYSHQKDELESKLIMFQTNNKMLEVTMTADMNLLQKVDEVSSNIKDSLTLKIKELERKNEQLSISLQEEVAYRVKREKELSRLIMRTTQLQSINDELMVKVIGNDTEITILRERVAELEQILECREDLKSKTPDRKTKATGISPRPTDHNFKCDDMNRITNSIIIRNIESDRWDTVSGNDYPSKIDQKLVNRPGRRVYDCSRIPQKDNGYDGDSEPIESSPRTEDDEYSSNGKKEGQRNSKFYLKSEGSSVKSSDENSQLINTRKRIRRCKVTDRYNSEFKNVKDRLVEMDKFDKIKKTRKTPKSRSTSEDSLERTHYEILESISHEAPDYIGEAEKLMHEIKSKRNNLRKNLVLSEQINSPIGSIGKKSFTNYDQNNIAIPIVQFPPSLFAAEEEYVDDSPAVIINQMFSVPSYDDTYTSIRSDNKYLSEPSYISEEVEQTEQDFDEDLYSEKDFVNSVVVIDENKNVQLFQDENFDEDRLQLKSTYRRYMLGLLDDIPERSNEDVSVSRELSKLTVTLEPQKNTDDSTKSITKSIIEVVPNSPRKITECEDTDFDSIRSVVNQVDVDKKIQAEIDFEQPFGNPHTIEKKEIDFWKTTKHVMISTDDNPIPTAPPVMKSESSRKKVDENCGKFMLTKSVRQVSQERSSNKDIKSDQSKSIHATTSNAPQNKRLKSKDTLLDIKPAQPRTLQARSRPLKSVDSINKGKVMKPRTSLSLAPKQSKSYSAKTGSLKKSDTQMQMSSIKRPSVKQADIRVISSKTDSKTPLMRKAESKRMTQSPPPSGRLPKCASDKCGPECPAVIECTSIKSRPQVQHSNTQNDESEIFSTVFQRLRSAGDWTDKISLVKREMILIDRFGAPIDLAVRLGLLEQAAYYRPLESVVDQKYSWRKGEFPSQKHIDKTLTDVELAKRILLEELAPLDKNINLRLESKDYMELLRIQYNLNLLLKKEIEYLCSNVKLTEIRLLSQIDEVRSHYRNKLKPQNQRALPRKSTVPSIKTIEVLAPPLPTVNEEIQYSPPPEPEIQLRHKLQSFDDISRSLTDERIEIASIKSPQDLNSDSTEEKVSLEDKIVKQTPLQWNSIITHREHESLTIEIVSLEIYPESEIMMNRSIKFIYMEYTFLGHKGHLLETPQSLPKPLPGIKLMYEFRKSFDFDYKQNFSEIRTLHKLLHSNFPTIKFLIISEPSQEDLHVNPDLECEEIGYAILDLKQLIDTCEADSKLIAIPAFAVPYPHAMVGVVEVICEGILFLQTIYQLNISRNPLDSPSSV